MTAPFPTRKQEAWRYADLKSLQQVWSDLAEPHRIEIAEQQKSQQIWMPGGEDVEVRRAAILVGAGAELSLFALNTAAEYGRVELDVIMHEGARFEFTAANIGTADANLEVVTTVRHIEPSAVSRQTVRSVLGGKAVGTYMGKVEVARGAQLTDGEQSVKAILLDRGATANCKPELEIYADDVKCAHGASVGELDAAQLFYAQSRGLDPASARALLLQGFIAGLWDSVEDDAQRAAISTAATDALRRVA
ncbi:MAG: SufD family Fe-S cluster assembly protein [Pseudomonadota bacterium]|nr:SufD family Fe-S cluster assembly protein [Sphingomonas sp.]MDQ3477822.1 SufD family Fe-S cluster assembly protein [Pseudomonadota bacterium]